MESSDYIKKEIPFINYVRDIKEADLYIILTSQSTGSGGAAYTYFLVGQKKFTGMTDTIIVNTLPDDTQDLIRIKQMKALKMGLMRYVMKTPLSRFLDIRFTQPVKEAISTDKWKSWVFRSRIYGYLNGESSYQEIYLSASVSANHITEKNKFEFSYSYNWDNVDYNTAGLKYNSFSRSQYANILNVKSLNDHWSAGAIVSARTSVYSNYKFKLTTSPAFEYDIFPYEQANRRQLRLLYQFGPEFSSYNDTTENFVLSEVRPIHTLTAAYQVIEKWGSINISFDCSNYLLDWKRFNLDLYGDAEIRIAKGLSFSISGSVGLVQFQRSLVKGGATYEEILLRSKQVATNYTYYTSVGLTYTFGSIYNNVVNPRFGN